MLGITVVSPTVCSPTVRVDSPASHMSVRLHVKICVTTVDHLLYLRLRSDLSRSIQFLERDS